MKIRKFPESEETDIFLVTPGTNLCYWPSFDFIVFFVQVVLILSICYSEMGYELHLVTHMINYQLWMKTSTISCILFCQQFDVVLFLFRDVPREIIQHIF